MPADYKVEVKGAKVTPSDAEEVSADLISDADKEKAENKREGKEVPETSRNEPSGGIENLLSNPRVPYVMMKPLSSEQPEFEKEPGKLNQGFKAYTGEGFSEINGYLRNTKRYSKVDSGTESFILKCISDMDKEISTSFIAKEVEIDGRTYSTNVLWRGIGGGNTAKRLYNAKIGDSVPDPGFQSYTCDLNTAVDWTRDNPSGFRVVLVHNVKPGEHGKLIGRASTTKNEYEIIRPRGLNETIVNIKDKTLHIKGKVVTVRMIYVE